MAKIAVAPLVGAWIEILMGYLERFPGNIVAPLVGAWIEIVQVLFTTEEYESLPSWERGLKLVVQMM